MVARHRQASSRCFSVALPGRLTNELRLWLVNDSGMPADWMASIQGPLPKQVISVVPAGTGVGVMKENYGASLRILLTVCSLVLLIACANIANLLLARGAARRANTSIRLAMGASRARLIRQSLTESLVLSVLGGVLGLAVAYLGVKAIVALAFHNAHYVPIDATPSMPVLAFAFVVSLITGMLFGSAPAWLTSHTDPAEALRGANRSTRDKSSFLAEGAGRRPGDACPWFCWPAPGLLTRSLLNMQRQDFGFEVDNRVEVSVTAPFSSYASGQARCHVSRVARPALTYSGRRECSPCPVRAVSGQLGRNGDSAGTRNAGHGRRGWLVVGPCEPRLSETDGPAASAWSLPDRARHLHRHQNVAVVDERVREAILQARRGAARCSFRTRSAEVQRHIRNRWSGAQRQLHRSQRPLDDARCSLCRWRNT